MRDKLIKLIASKPELLINLNISVLQVMRFADHLIANGVTFAEDDNVPCKWIPATMPPKESGYYLVAYKDKYNGSRRIGRDFFAKCDAGEWWKNDFGRTVTHWMPLPEPPKEGE